MNSGPVRFQLARLVSFDDADLINELRRVASTLDSTAGPFTRGYFKANGRVSASAVVRRFGGWSEALDAAGLGALYGGPPVSKAMRAQETRHVTNDRIVEELRRVAIAVGSDHVSQSDFEKHSSGEFSPSLCVNRFGGWTAALRSAGLQSAKQRRRSLDGYFENLLTVWTALGRQPKYREMNDPPSSMPSRAYVRRFGTWNSALVAFVERMNEEDSDDDPAAGRPLTPADQGDTASPPKPRTIDQGVADYISVSLRYKVLRRDHFRCVRCGASPAIERGVTLHVDHEMPRARGGTNTEANLRTLCQSCNLGKGAKLD